MSDLRVITKPEVYLLSRPSLDQAELDRFLTDHGTTWASDSDVAPQVLCEVAGRVCYDSYSKPRPGGNKAYLDHIIESGHGSVLEHAVWGFLFTGISRNCSLELIRHRAGASPSQRSQRYVAEDDAAFVEPSVIADDNELHEMWLQAVQASQDAYRKLASRLSEKLSAPCYVETGCYHPNCAGGWQKDKLRDKVFAVCAQCKGTERRQVWSESAPSATDVRKAARQAARSVLPGACETRVYWTANARTIRNCLEQRCSDGAEPEIRALFNAVYRVMIREAPSLFGDYREHPLPDGTFALETENRKV